MTQEEAEELNKQMWVPTKTIDQLSDEAFEIERKCNMNFWNIPDDDPEVLYWKEVWRKGYRKAIEQTII